jgi:hypothetical protein
MAVGDKQKLITSIVGMVLNEQPMTGKQFDWLINKHMKEYFGEHFVLIDKIFKSLNGDINGNQNKRTVLLDCDAFFGGEYNFIFEFDEIQHFTSARLKTLELYPAGLIVNFNIDKWKQLCKNNKDKADKYRKSRTTADFDFDGGRSAQRAYLDCFRDLLPQQHGLSPTLRINEFEVATIHVNNKDACKKIEQLLKSKLKSIS